MLKWAPGDCLNEREMLERCASGQFKMSVAWEGESPIACAIYEFDERRNGTLVLSVIGLVGYDRAKWQVEMERHLDEEARSAGCDSMETLARLASAKWLAGNGWKKRAVLMEKSYHGQDAET